MTEPITSKKWVDYSDEDSSQEDHHHQQHPIPKQPDTPVEQKPKNDKPKPSRPSKAEIDAELDKLDELDDARVDEVWLQMTSQNRNYLDEEARYLKSKAKKGGNIVSVYPSRTTEGYDVRVYIKIAYDYIQNGYDSTDEIEMRVADRNFEKQPPSREPMRGRQPEFKQKNSENQKRRYVDKETGLEPEPKKKKEEENAENDRKYTKEEAEKKGELLGNFRAKSKKEEEVKQETQPEQKSETKLEEKKESQTEKEKEKIEVKAVESKPKETKKEKNEKREKKGKPAGPKIKSQNRFEGIEDLS